MADSPQALMNALSEIAFMPAEQYDDVTKAQIAERTWPLGVAAISQQLEESSDPRRDITAQEIGGYLDALTAIAVKSKADGNLLWGRVQGTKYEREGSNWVQQKLQEFGFGDIRKDRVPARRPLWWLDDLELSVVRAPGFGVGQEHRFTNALTAYQSATTPKQGLVAEVVYVGEGTPAELQGRDLEGKIVLLRSRGLPGSLFHSARVAYSRLATLERKPAAVIVWPDVPGASQVAARVGSVGGGENIGLALPWTTINNNDGYYLRKLVDRASPENPVKVRLNVQGREQGADERYSYNVYGLLPGRSGKYILHLAHVDGFLYALHCNAGAVAMNLALANHYGKMSAQEREHGHIFLFVGDHENPGVGATDKFIENNTALVNEDLLIILRPEKPGMVQQTDEGWIQANSNVAVPGMLMVTNRSPLIIDLFRQAIKNYAISTADFIYADPAADETNFHPPYFDGGVISAGWATGTRYYHSTADFEQNLISTHELEKMARAHAFISDELGNYNKSDLEAGAVPYRAENSIYQSDVLKMMFGNH
ncbi:MAG: hypothetical protein ABJ171_08320 [Halieaceae bacterium]